MPPFPHTSSWRGAYRVVKHRDCFAGSLFPVATLLTELLWFRIMLYETTLLKIIIILTRHLPEFRIKSCGMPAESWNT
jgi:hypothetical protein